MGIPHFIRNDRQLDFFGSGRAAASKIPMKIRSFQPQGGIPFWETSIFAL